MFIAHLPAAYIGFKTLAPKLSKPAFFAGMVGSIAPDIDLLWLHFVDAVPNHHHDYITHRPALWGGMLAIGFLMYRSRKSDFARSIMAFACGALLHMILDTIAGKIGWLWPFSDFAKPLVVVPATQANWILSFLTHWTFGVEIVITFLALLLLVLNFRRP